MVELFANSRDPDQTPRFASDLGLHCLPIILFGVSRLQWVNICLSEKGHEVTFHYNSCFDITI